MPGENRLGEQIVSRLYLGGGGWSICGTTLCTRAAKASSRPSTSARVEAGRGRKSRVNYVGIRPARQASRKRSLRKDELDSALCFRQQHSAALTPGMPD